MATYEVTERPRNTSTGETDGQTGSRSSSRLFHVLVTSGAITETADTVRAFAPLPNPGDPHPTDLGMFCRRKTVQKVSVLLYEATCDYETPRGGGSGGGDNPLSAPAVIRFSHVVTEEQIDQDMDGKPICCLATLEQFDPPITRQFGDLQMTVTKNVATFDPLQAYVYMFAVNSDSFFGADPGVCLLTQFEAENVVEGAFQYWRRTVGIQFRSGQPNTTNDKAWYRRIRAEGYYIRIPNREEIGQPVKTYHAIDAEKQPVTKPVLHKISNGQAVDDQSDPTLAEWYEFKIYRSLPFAALNIL